MRKTGPRQLGLVFADSPSGGGTTEPPYAGDAEATGQHRRIRRGDLMPDLDMFSPARLSRQLRRLRAIGVIKRVTGTYRYHLTKAGRAAAATASGSPRPLSFRR